jgi:hypothetical protein
MPLWISEMRDHFGRRAAIGASVMIFAPSQGLADNF